MNLKSDGNILYINDVVFQSISGELYHTVGFLNGLISNGYQVKYLTYGRNRSHLTKLNSNIKITEIPSYKIKALCKTLYIFHALYSILSTSASIIYIRESVYTPFLICLVSIFLWVKKRKMYLEINGVREYESSGIFRLINGTLSKIGSLVYKKSVERIFVVSEGIKNYLKQKYNYKNISVLENGALDKRETIIPQNIKREKRIVFIGGLSIWQDFEYLVQVVDENRREFTQLGFIIEIYGDGPTRPKFVKSIHNHQLTEVLQYKGKIHHDEIESVLLNASYGLLLDTRIFQGKLLFSPLKYYEYAMLNLPTLYITRKEDALSSYSDIIFVNRSNFVFTIEAIGSKNIVTNKRTWIDVAREAIEQINVE